MKHERYPMSLALGGAILAATVVCGQDVRMNAAALYESGVEAYFSGQLGAADSYLTRAIAANPNDPRSYYFRGLSKMREGRSMEARGDMQIGAALEAKLPNRFDIGKTLERVQGSSRLVLEEYRATARRNSAMNPPQGPVRSPDTAVLRERRVVPLEEFGRPGEPHTVAMPEVQVVDLAPVPPAAAKAVGAPAIAPAAAPDNPFGDDAKVAPTAKGSAAEMPADESAADEAPAAKAGTTGRAKPATKAKAAPPKKPGQTPAAPAPKTPPQPPKESGDNGNPFL